MRKILLTIIISFITLNMWADTGGRCGENVTWTYYETTNTLTISGYGKMYDYYLGSTVTRAPWCLNGYTTSIKKIYIKDSVTSIGSCAFFECSGLTSVTIGNSVTEIGSWAFGECSGLKSVIIPNGVTSIGQAAFSGCSGLKSVIIPNGVTSIGSCAFSGCTSLTSVTIPNSVTSIGESAFHGCSGLISVTIGKSVESIGSKAFNCENLLSVVSLIENPFAIDGKSSSYPVFSTNTFMNADLFVPVGTINKYKAIKLICDESVEFFRSDAYRNLEKQAKDIIFYQFTAARFGRDLMSFTINWYENLSDEIRSYDE